MDTAATMDGIMASNSGSISSKGLINGNDVALEAAVENDRINMSNSSVRLD